jgi:hypothetical protein
VKFASFSRRARKPYVDGLVETQRAGLAAEGAAAGLRMRHLPSAGIGDGGNSVSSDADGVGEVVLAAYLMGRDKRGVSANFCSANWG